MRNRLLSDICPAPPRTVLPSAARLVVVTVLVLCACLDPSFAQDAEEDTPPSPEQQAFLDAVRKLEWVSGPTEVQLPGKATMQLPDGFVYLDQKNTLKFLEVNENLGGGDEVMVAPEDLAWSAYLSYLKEGYVKDDEQIDADALLKELSKATESANSERRKRGWDELHVAGWAVTPNYNRDTKRLEWATILDSSNGRGVNFFTKVLGRRGHTSVQLVSSADGLTGAESSLNSVLGGFKYKEGEGYADFRPGDKVAEYGLAAMVLGGAAAVATKKGLWGVLAGFFAAAWKFLAAAVIGGLAWLKSLFKKKE
jgi:uncharacterized membrane-anchored protein